jgi:hypothetical protein
MTKPEKEVVFQSAEPTNADLLDALQEDIWDTSNMDILHVFIEESINENFHPF